jgi:hypothetical protein
VKRSVWRERSGGKNLRGLDRWFSDRIGCRQPLLILCVHCFVLSWLLVKYSPGSPGTTGYFLFDFIGVAGSGFGLTFAAATSLLTTNSQHR